MEASTGNRKQVLILAAAPSPPGLTCPGAAQMCSSVGVVSTNVPTTVPCELEGCPGPSQPLFMSAPAGPTLWLATSSQPQGNPRTPGPGAFTGFICFSRKVKNMGLSHIESIGSSKGTSAEALISRTWWLKEGGVPCHCWGPPQRGTLLPLPRGRIEMRRAGLVSSGPCTAL